MGKPIFVVGFGNIGFHILHLLARTPGIGKIIIADKIETNNSAKIENVIIGAAIQGFYPEIKFVKVDLDDIENTSKILREIDPEIVCNAALMDQTFRTSNQLPPDVAARFREAGNGPLMPMPLTLTYKLMQAVKKSGRHPHVINCAYGDAVNAVLAKVGLAPTVGAGNIDLWSQQVRKYASEKLKTRLRNISIFMVAHHGVISSRGQAPFWYEILLNDKNVTDNFPPEEIRPLMRYTTLWPEPGEHIASSFAKSIADIYFNTGEIRHAPGPMGLQGGYPIRLDEKGAEVVLPDGLTLEAATRINEQAARFDGIERIKPEGTVVFTEKSSEIMRETLGYDCKELKINECEEKAKEINSLFDKLAKKYIVQGSTAKA
jgi:hypothetical protein